MKSHLYPFTPLYLPYSFNALEPFISKDALQLNYEYYYKNNINKLNNLIKSYPTLKIYTLEEGLFNQMILPSFLRKEYLFYAGGIYNYELFFENLSLYPKILPHGNFKEAIRKKFGNFDTLLNQLIALSKSVNNYSYLLVVSTQNKNIHIMGTKDNDTSVPFNLCPLIVINICEHMYFTDYKEDLTQYIKNIFSCINFDVVESRYNNCFYNN